MRSPRVRVCTRRLFLWLCTATLVATVWLGSFSKSVHTTAHANDPQQLVRTGVDYYQSGRFTAALDPWLTAYTAYEITQDLPALAIVSENLARAYQQLGQTSVEIDYWQQAIAATQMLNNAPKIGRLLTEQAQAYSRLGQHRRAIAILCGNSTTDITSANAIANGELVTDRSFPSKSETCQPGSALYLAESTADLVGQMAALGGSGGGPPVERRSRTRIGTDTTRARR